MAFKAYAQVGHKRGFVVREIMARRAEARRGAGRLGPSIRERLTGQRPGFRPASETQGGTVGVRVAQPLSTRIKNARVENRKVGLATTIQEGRQADRSRTAGMPVVRGTPGVVSQRIAHARIQAREAASRDKTASPSADLQSVGKQGPRPGQLAQPFQWRARSSPQTDARRIVPNPPRGMRFF